MGYDDALGANFLTYHDEKGTEHTVYLPSAKSISQGLAVAQQFALGAVVVDGVDEAGAPANLADGLSAFLNQQPMTPPQALQIVWRVSDELGAKLDEQAGDLSLVQYMWQAVSTPGKYTISAALNGQGQEDPRGQLDVEVVSDIPTPTPTTAPTAAATQKPAATAAPAATQSASTPPPPVAASGAGGGFELGGQVNGGIYHADLMRQAGMTWVKFQQKWSPGMDPSVVAGYISAGHANGFKVLLSIPGTLYPSSIDFNGYVNFLGGVAALGPDAIEVWNEMNLNREWPTGQIDPASYVNNMLAPSFNAIKSANPNVMVIIGALAPTGVDDGTNVWSDQRYVQGLAAAGAAQYADCLGIHHNAGATSPSATTGHPAGTHYSWYFKPTIDVYYGGIGGALPLCFTEYGYVSPEGFGGPLPSTFSWGQDNTVAEQAQWLAEGVQIAKGLGYVRLMVIWNVDFTNYGDDPQAGYAIVRPDGSCPACSTLAAVK